MQRYVIERDIPDIGLSEQASLRQGAEASNKILSDMRVEKKNIQWEHAYVADNKTFCIYLADKEDLIYEHAQRSGFPVTKVTEIGKIIDPVTAEAR